MTESHTSVPEETVRWGILGPGRIARAFATGLAASRTGRLVAVGSRDVARSQALIDEHPDAAKGGTVRAHGSYADLLADADVDAIYLATPHPQHAEWAIAAARAGKHLLVEKPLTPTRAASMVVLEAARTHDVFCMEAYMYRCHPQTRALVELVTSGAIGRVVSIQASFSFGADVDPTSRAYARDLAGGGILDVGGYPVSMARLLAGAALGVDGQAKPYDEPVTVTAAGHLAETGVDDWAVASLTFASGITAQVHTGVGLGTEPSCRVYGADGWIDVANPWLPCRDGRPAGLVVHRPHQEPEQIEVDTPELYASEADHVAAHLAQRQAPAMDWADTLANMAVLDEWREQLGVVYPGEGPSDDFPAVAGDPVVVREPGETSMRCAEVPGTGRQASRIVMGVDHPKTLPLTSALFDDFVARGGTAFDTAWLYGGGRPEQLMGQWMRNRGIRDELFLIGKGAHTPHVTPEAIHSQLDESLQRLQTDWIDQYFMHRDDPAVPVGEFVDAMDAEVRAGRIKAYGGSNWTIARFEEANDWAREHGRTPMTALSNTISLAEALDVPWAGCQAMTDRASKQWLARTGTAIFPWSAQARGFFARAAEDDRRDAELVRCYYSPENFERLRRARALGDELGVSPTAIALAWLLHQPFPVFPLIGPRQISETVGSLDGLQVELTDEQVAHLDLLD
ncbi:MAG TPA: aldo/keto reductase [Candidatus Avipropionibacterium avicola]|uniref:Aldo/keto reductase n=1 Tax=Candidatus Avipropionibacterium avicola TaxID=2840701 RepID=A0A9D1GWN8_9ACTN|nr:aldo/keto reductase [Candidatus Avipropionibacterium avicola]